MESQYAVELTSEAALAVVARSQADASVHTAREVATAVELLVATTRATYDIEADRYERLRGSKLTSADRARMRILLEIVRGRVTLQGDLAVPSKRWRLLDVGAGYGEMSRYCRVSRILM
jgi:hypothetical protein